MAFPSLLFVLLVSLSVISLSNSQLTENYYEKTCPNFEKIMTNITTAKQQTTPRTMGSALRLLFHDCMVDGCDASILLSSPYSASENETEKQVKINRLLSVEAFELVNALKEALENECPGVVSCADILAYSTRSLVEMVGGPHFKLPLGRKDGKMSAGSHVEGNLAKATDSMDEMIRQFNQYGMTMEDLAALTVGGHTAGASHCKSFGGKPVTENPDMEYFKMVADKCNGNTLTRIQLDEVTPFKFDSVYIEQMKKNRIVFRTDQLFVTDPRTRVLLDAWSKDEKALFDAFVRGMEKLVMIGIKNDTNGEVRTRCDMINSVDI